MNQLRCEMCGGTDLIKQDGVFVCQNCGMKYSVEEARKMMIEGTVEVQGTVKVDNSAFVEKYLVNARRAKEKEDWDESEKYYNMVEQNDPSNIEAIFYSAYSKARACLTSDDIYRREAIFKALTNSVSIIDDNYDVSRSGELVGVLEQMNKDVIGMFGSSFVFTQYKNGYGTVTGDNRHKTWQLFINLTIEMYKTLGNIIAKLPAGAPEIFRIHCLRLALAELMATHEGVSTQSREIWVGHCREVAATMQRMNPNYVPKNYDTFTSNIKKDKNKNNLKGVFTAIGVIAIVALTILWIYGDFLF